nr:hypothetical protein [Tanacetum cinerariifolium]
MRNSNPGTKIRVEATVTTLLQLS